MVIFVEYVFNFRVGPGKGSIALAKRSFTGFFGASAGSVSAVNVSFAVESKFVFVELPDARIAVIHSGTFQAVFVIFANTVQGIDRTSVTRI